MQGAFYGRYSFLAVYVTQSIYSFRELTSATPFQVGAMAIRVAYIRFAQLFYTLFSPLQTHLTQHYTALYNHLSYIILG